MRLVCLRTILAVASAQAFFAAAAPLAAAERFPVPSITIYPGDIVRDGMLTEKEFPDSILDAGFVNRRSDLVGKVAKRTLLPGQAIAANAVVLPKLVTIGAMVRLVYEEGGLVISTYASALQAGAAGDLISVRNLESGITLSGIVAPDGSIHVGNG